MSTNETSNVKEPGISIEHTGTVGVMNDYRVRFFRPGQAVVVESQRMLHSASITVWAKLRAQSIGWAAKWITGDGVDKMTARKERLRFYQNVPGAGRPRKPDGEKFVPIPGNAHPDDIAIIQAAAKKSGKSIGEEIMSRFR